MKPALFLLALLVFAPPAQAAEPEVNPFLPAYPYKTVRIVVDETKPDLSPSRLTYSIKGNLVRVDISGGVNDTTYDLITPEFSYHVMPAGKEIITHPSGAAYFHKFFSALSEEQKKTVNANIRKIGAQMPYYEFWPKSYIEKSEAQTLLGQPAECALFTFDSPDGTKDYLHERCFWYGIELSAMQWGQLKGAKETDPAFTKKIKVLAGFTPNLPLEDALFVPPAGYRAFNSPASAIEDAMDAEDHQAAFDSLAQPNYEFKKAFVHRESAF